MNLTYTQSKTIRDAGKALDSALALLESVRDSVAALHDDPASQPYCNRKISILVATISNAVSGARDAKRASEDLLGRNLLEVLKEESRKAEKAGRLLVSFSLPLQKLESDYFQSSSELVDKILGVEIIEGHKTADTAYLVAMPPVPCDEFISKIASLGANILQIRREP